MCLEIHSEHQDSIEEPQACNQVNEEEICCLRARISTLSRAVEDAKRRMLVSSDPELLDQLAAEIRVNQVDLEHLRAQLAALQQEHQGQPS